MSALLNLAQRAFTWLLGPRQRDPESLRAARLLVKVILITQVALIAVQAQYGVREMMVMAAVCDVIWLLALVLNRALGSHIVGGHVFAFGVWLLFFGMATVSGGVNAPILASNTFVAVIALMLLGRWHGLVWVGAAVLTAVVQFQLTQHDLVLYRLPPEAMESSRMAETIAACVFVSLVAISYEREKERMRLALANEKQLLEAANADLRIILDNAKQGFLSLDPEGRLIGERSAVIDEWFHSPARGTSFAAVLAEYDPAVATWFELSWEQLTTGILPADLCIEQLPERLVTKTATYRLEYELVHHHDGDIARVVVILSDITGELKEEQAAVRQQDLLAAFDWLLRDPSAFRTFLVHARRDVDCLKQNLLQGDDLKRCLHTLKGNSAVMGLSAMAALCHQLEDELAANGQPTEASQTALNEELQVVVERLGRFLDERDDNNVELADDEYDRFLTQVRSKRPHFQLEREVLSWRGVVVERPLQRLAEHARQLAKRLGKEPLEIHVEAQPGRVPPTLDDFWDVMVHVVRNAIDHGLEAADDREKHGKGTANLWLRARSTPNGTLVEVADDGAGIDWEQVAERARRLGLPATTRHELVRALLTDGVSTRSEVTEISGRGVGLGGVRTVCEALDIPIEVMSEPRAGTCFRFLLPAHAARELEQNSLSA